MYFLQIPVYILALKEDAPSKAYAHQPFLSLSIQFPLIFDRLTSKAELLYVSRPFLLLLFFFFFLIH